MRALAARLRQCLEAADQASFTSRRSTRPDDGIAGSARNRFSVSPARINRGGAKTYNSQRSRAYCGGAFGMKAIARAAALRLIEDSRGAERHRRDVFYALAGF